MTFMNCGAKMCQISRKIATFSQYPGSLGWGNKSRAAQTFEKSKEMLPVLASATAKCDVHGPLVLDFEVAPQNSTLSSIFKRLNIRSKRWSYVTKDQKTIKSISTKLIPYFWTKQHDYPWLGQYRISECPSLMKWPRGAQIFSHQPLANALAAIP